MLLVDAGRIQFSADHNFYGAQRCKVPVSAVEKVMDTVGVSDLQNERGNISRVQHQHSV